MIRNSVFYLLSYGGMVKWFQVKIVKDFYTNSASSQARVHTGNILEIMESDPEKKR
jgi:hypothetical protein